MKLIRPLALLFTILSVISQWHTQTAHACAGVSTIYDSLEVADNFVKASIQSIDDTGGNAILHVNTYYIGHGEEYITLFDNTIGEINTGSFVQCSGGINSLGYDLTIGDSIYLSLYESFIPNVYSRGRIFHFPDPTSTAYVVLERERYDTTSTNITETELLDIIYAFSGQAPMRPIANYMPLPSALQIITTNGSHYVMSPDVQSIVAYDGFDLVTFYNSGLLYNGVNGGYFYDYVDPFWDAPCIDDPNCYVFAPNYTNVRRRIDEDGNPVHLLFSPNSDIAAFWLDDTIEIRTHYDVIATTRINPTDVSLPAFAVWSPDGGILAYSDQRGLWLWDMDDDGPTLFMDSTNDTVPLALRFSPLGTYLAIQLQDQVQYVNLLNGETQSDGLFSPDESELLVYDTLAQERTALQHCDLVTLICNNYSYEDFLILDAPVWLSNSDFLVNVCYEPYDLRQSCTLRLGANVHIPLLSDEKQHSLFAYQTGTDLIAVINGNHEIEIYKREYLGLRLLATLDFTGMLDSPIEAINWFPSFFYEFDN